LSRSEEAAHASQDDFLSCKKVSVAIKTVHDEENTEFRIKQKAYFSPA
jgi:hypothetical protein